MTKARHPDSRLQRRIARLKKHKLNEQKKTEAQDRAGKVWRKLNRELYQEQETENELNLANHQD